MSLARVARSLAAALLALASACGGGEARPNVLLISVDTLRPDFLGCYGHERETSPAIDRLAAGGTLFEDVTAASPWTLPSHASMLSGLYPSTHGVKDHENQLEAETLATRLADSGYQTMAVVNSHNVGTPAYGLTRGFEGLEYVLEMEEREDGHSVITNRGDVITRRGIRYLKERDLERPFFLFLHYYDVHTDFTPDPKWQLEFVDPYDGKLNGTTGQLVGYRNREQPLEDEDIRWLQQMYEAEIRTLDEHLERLFQYLDATGLAESTLVVLTSDHGEEFFEHQGVLHGRTHYEELVRIPLILRGPGVPAGERVAAPVHLVDVAPTVYSLAGIHPGGDLDGIDLSLYWRDPERIPEYRFLFSEADHNNVVDGQEVTDIKRMVRLKHDKLHFDTVTEEKELYDLRSDPLEAENLVRAESERADALWERLEAFMRAERTGKYIGPVDAETDEKLRKLGY